MSKLYVIDGYNVLFRLLHKGESVQAARDAMIVYLGRKVTHLGLKAILVFDSAYQEGLATAKKEGEMAVVFTGEGQTADEWILHRVKEKEKENLCVVTTDKTLAKHVRLKGAETLSCEDFLKYINKRALKKKVPPKPLLELKKKVTKGSLEYYEAIFEKELEGVILKPISIESKPAERAVKALETENERWMRLFGA